VHFDAMKARPQTGSAAERSGASASRGKRRGGGEGVGSGDGIGAGVDSGGGGATVGPFGAKYPHKASTHGKVRRANKKLPVWKALLMLISPY